MCQCKFLTINPLLQEYCLVLNIVLMMLTSPMGVLELESQLSSCLLMCPWEEVDLSPCLPQGRPSLSSWLLHLAWYNPIHLGDLETETIVERLLSLSTMNIMNKWNKKVKIKASILSVFVTTDKKNFICFRIALFSFKGK